MSYPLVSQDCWQHSYYQSIVFVWHHSVVSWLLLTPADVHCLDHPWARFGSPVLLWYMGKSSFQAWWQISKVFLRYAWCLCVHLHRCQSCFFLCLGDRSVIQRLSASPRGFSKYSLSKHLVSGNRLLSDFKPPWLICYSVVVHRSLHCLQGPVRIFDEGAVSVDVSSATGVDYIEFSECVWHNTFVL